MLALQRRATSSAVAVQCTAAASGVCATRTFMRPHLAEPPLDKQAGDKTRKGPPVAHALPIYQQTHKLHGSARWKTANLVTNVAGGKDYRLAETHGEGRVDETGMYRDWLYGEERRYANYVGIALFCTSASLFYFTIRTMGSESWDIPAPLLVKTPATASRNDGAAAADAGAAPTANVPMIAARPSQPVQKGNATVIA
jgi:hypothetical protein